ncbi:hypothetical protein MESS4_530096 [Mesorhizobium sp. STM 4661]|nr:hypothetical protein MESS4_530096 [Mesorhizobium sp. STM 4661]
MAGSCCPRARIFGSCRRDPRFRQRFFLRQATEADHPALAAICLKTGDAGNDATDREDALDLLGLIYTIPYQVLEPDLAFIVDGPAGASGYLLGAADTHAFNARLAAEWYPCLQARVGDPGSDRSRWRGSDWVRHLIHHPDFLFAKRWPPIRHTAISTSCRRHAEKASAGAQWLFSSSALPRAAQRDFALWS